ncbi:hypothetical protein [Mesorhizobium abyssinicae]
MIGTSVFANAVASLAWNPGNWSVSPRRLKHSTSPRSAQTLSGCWAQR